MKTQDILKKNIATFIILFLAGLVFGVLGLKSFQYKGTLENQKISQDLLRKEKLSEKKIKEKDKLRSEIVSKVAGDIEAEAVYIRELDGDLVYQKNQNKKFGIASITKIATAKIALDNFNHDAEVKIKRSDLSLSDDNGLFVGETFKVKDLLGFMLAVSSNDAARAISSSLKNQSIKNKDDFILEMNTYTERQNLSSILFFSESGLDFNDKILGAYGNAKDISYMVEDFYKTYPSFSARFSNPISTFCSNYKCHKAENTNEILKHQTGVLFSKTGYTKKSGGSLSLVYKTNEKKYIIVVLGGTKFGRFTDMDSILRILDSYSEV